MTNSHRWKLVAAAGVALMIFAYAYEERYDTPYLFAVGAGAASAGLLLWRDPPKSWWRSSTRSIQAPDVVGSI